MKNLEDAYTIRDPFFNDKSTKDEPGKLNVEAEVVSMVIVLIYQASSSVPPMSTPVIDLSPPKPASSTTQAPVFTATTSTTTTTSFEQKSKTLDNTTHNLGSRVFNLELRDLPHKIDETVRETVKEAVQVALQVPLRDRFRDLPEADMKEMIHQRMFETGSYRSLPEHVALYEALVVIGHMNLESIISTCKIERMRASKGKIQILLWRENESWLQEHHPLMKIRGLFIGNKREASLPYFPNLTILVPRLWLLCYFLLKA
ncbi:hypothetical protein Tco_1241996 [Tanacetum coccineum]